MVHADSRKFHPVIKAAGINAHSDDTVEIINGVQYAVTEILDWRAKPFTEALRLCSTLHLSTKFKITGELQSPNFPRPRMTGTRKSARPAVTGLPSNCYDEGWKKRMGKEFCKTLNMTKPVDLTISKEVAA